MSNRQPKDRGKRGKKTVDLNKNMETPGSPSAQSVNTPRYHLRSYPSDSVDEFPPLPNNESHKKTTVGVQPPPSNILPPANHQVGYKGSALPQKNPIDPIDSGLRKNIQKGLGPIDVQNQDSRDGDLSVQNEDDNNRDTDPIPPPPVNIIDVGEENEKNQQESSKNNNNMAQGDANYQPNSPKNHTQRTYASIFQDATNICKKGTLRFIPPLLTENGNNRAVIPSDLLLKQSERWSCTVVGHFIGKRPAFPFVRFHANRLWKKFDLDDVILNDQGFFLFKFKTEQGQQHVFENGPWLFNDIPILLRKWQPEIWFEKPVFNKVAIWVNIYDMPAVMWNYEILSHVVSAIGIPISVDRYTADMCEKNTGRAVFARVLVEFNAEKEIPKFVEVDVLGTVRKFRLEYHWLPSRCSHCKIYGHKFEDCSERPRTQAEVEDRTANTAPAGAAGATGAKEGTSGARPVHGEFHQPKRRKRRPKKDQATVTTKTKVQYIPRRNEDKTGNAETRRFPTDTESSSTVRFPTQIPTDDTTTPDSHVGGKTQTPPAPDIENRFDVLGDMGTETDQIDINVFPFDEEKRKEDLEVQEEVEATMAMGDAVCVDFAGWEAQIESIIRSERVKKTQQHE